jgi:cob(I)alamin adenosyltransferase
MVNLTRIYTKTGDDGSTALGDMSRTTKNDPRLVAYADVDEANSAIGVAIALGELPEPIKDLLTTIQNDLFDVGADLCIPVVAEPKYPQLRITEAYVAMLEDACDRYNEDLTKLRSFILPGGTTGGARVRGEHEPAHREVPQPAFRSVVHPRPYRQRRAWRRAVATRHPPVLARLISARGAGGRLGGLRRSGD